jgi:hypothetical protein
MLGVDGIVHVVLKDPLLDVVNVHLGNDVGVLGVDLDAHCAPALLQGDLVRRGSAVDAHLGQVLVSLPIDILHSLQQLPASAVQLVLHIHHNGVAHDCFVKRLEQ